MKIKNLISVGAPNSAAANKSLTRFNATINNPSSCTSLLSKVREAESCTNLHKKLHSESETTFSHNCPLCAASKGQCHLHHRTMCSRYMTDLEWRICHAVNIYVYKNGEEGQTPVLIHIPPSKNKNMRCVMSVIQERICYPIGYAKHLYRMNGKKITNPCELEMYNNYIVASNYDKTFKCVCYGRRKSPLLVLAKESKHVRELRLKNYQYELYLAKKRAAEDERPNCVYGGNSNCNTHYAGDSFGPSEMSIGPGCPSKVYSKRRHRRIVVPTQEQQQQIRSRNDGCISFATTARNAGPAFDQPGNVGIVFENSRNGLPPRPPFAPSSSSRNLPLGNTFCRNIETPMSNGRPRSSVIFSMNEATLPREYQPKKPFIYTLNTCTITTAPLKDPAKYLQKNSNNTDDDELDNQLNGSSRYKGIINDEESLFYSSKKNKVNRGVIDVSGEKKKIFYHESDLLNGNVDSDLEDMQKYDACEVYSTDKKNDGSLSKFKPVEAKQNFSSMNQNENFSSIDNQIDLNNNSSKFCSRNVFNKLEEKGDDGQFGNLKETSIVMEEGEENDTSLYSNENRLEQEMKNVETKEQNYIGCPATVSKIQNNELQSQTAITTMAMDDNNLSISAPSRSYTILAHVPQAANSAHHRHTQVTPLVSSVQQSTFPGHLDSSKKVLKDITNACSSNNNNYINKHCSLKAEDNLVNNGEHHQLNQYQDPNQYLYGSSPSPSIHLSRNQTSYTSYRPNNGYYVQPTAATKLVQPPMHQICPVEILNQRPPYGHHHQMTVDEDASFGNCYATTTDEIDIPYTPLYHRRMTTDPVGQYMQVPFVTTELNQQFSYRGDLQSYASSRHLGIATINKPSRRNVAIQMGEPILNNNNSNNNISSSQVLASPRPSQQIFYSSIPAYYYTPANVIHHSMTAQQKQQQTNFSFNQNVSNPNNEDSHSAQQQQQQSNIPQNTLINSIPPPTRYRDPQSQRDCGLFELRSCRAFSKQSNDNNNSHNNNGRPVKKEQAQW